VRAASLRRDPHLVKRLLASAAATALALGGLLVATAAPASAHTPDVSATCTELSVNLSQYSARGTKDNTVTVTVDGQQVDRQTFPGSFTGTYPVPDPTRATSWEVSIEAWDDPHGRNGWTKVLTGRTIACPGQGQEVQVGIYLYPKLDASRDAAWENSGPQDLLTTKTLTLSLEEQKSGEHWFTELPEGTLEGVDLCEGWGIQQDLVRGGPDEYTMPEAITYPDGSSMDGHLVDWTHQELDEFGVTLPSAADCDIAPVDDEVEPTAVAPVPPATIESCEADAVPVKPTDSPEVTYLVRTDGVLATPATGFVFGADLAGYQLLDDGSALFPIADLQPAAEDCALVAGEITAVCEGDVPYLGYAVSLPAGIEVDDETPLSITFLNPGDGENWTVTDQPLSGRVLWPGASAEEPRQWPGWLLTEDGSYVETEGNYAWTRDGVEVLFEVNPSYSTVVSYPPATSECANPPAGTVGVVDAAAPPAGPALATTGATVAGAAAFAALLVGGGALVFWLRRRVQS